MKNSTKIKILSLMVASVTLLGAKKEEKQIDDEFLDQINDLSEGIYEYNNRYYEVLYAPCINDNYNLTYYALDGYYLYSTYMVREVKVDNKQKILELN